MSLSPELEDRISSNQIDLENIPAGILVNSATSFKIAAKSNNTGLISKLLELTPNDPERSRMIHSQDDIAFIWAAKNGHTQIIDKLLQLTPNEPERSQMIHTGNNIAFIWAYENGQTELWNKLLRLTPNSQEKFKVMDANIYDAFISAVENDNTEITNTILVTQNTPERPHRAHISLNTAFHRAAQLCDTKVIKILLGLTPNDRERSQMIHDCNDIAFVDAAGRGHGKIIDILLELTPNERERSQMIHAHDNHAFRKAATNGFLEIINKLVELTPNELVRSRMISTLFQPHLTHNKKVQELLTLIQDEEIPGFQELNPERMTKLRELRSDLITNLSGKTEQSPEQQTATIKKANYVMAKLLNKDNLQEAKDLLQNKDLLGEGKASIPMPETLQDIVVNYLSIPTESLKFRSLENPDAAIALDTIKDFFHKKPRTKVLGTREENEKVERLKMTEKDHNI